MIDAEHHGSPLSAFAGEGVVAVSDSAGLIHGRGQFHATQSSSGRLVVSIVPEAPFTSTAHQVSGAPGDGLSFIGHTTDGWSLENRGETFYSGLLWFMSPFSRDPNPLDFRPSRLSAKSGLVSDSCYASMTFLLSNLLWHGHSSDLPEPIKVTTEQFAVSIEPVGEYLRVSQRLATTHSIEPTALVSVNCRNGERLHMDRFTEFLDSFIYLFRLLTGNRISWYSGDAIDENSGNTVERIHNNCITAPYSNTIRFAPLRAGYISGIPKVNFPELAEAFYHQQGHYTDARTLRNLIDYFSNACDDLAYLEIRGLMASTLNELLVTTYARSTGRTEIIEESEFSGRVLPSVRSALREIDLSPQMREQLAISLQGAYRTTFRQRLRQLVDDGKIDLESADLGRIVRIRNSLVHDGTYPSQERKLWLNDYLSMMWTNFAILCRLLGYEGQLPFFIGSDIASNSLTI